jgi:hypothetical protein
MEFDPQHMLDTLASGVLMREYIEEHGIEYWRIRRMAEADPIFKEALQAARYESWDNLAERLFTDAKKAENPGLARVQLDSGKFLLAARKPEVYGQRVDVHVEHTVRIDDALREARARVLPQRDQQQIEDAQIVDVVKQLPGVMPDSESDKANKDDDDEDGDAAMAVWD